MHALQAWESLQPARRAVAAVQADIDFRPFLEGLMGPERFQAVRAEQKLDYDFLTGLDFFSAVQDVVVPG